MDAPKLIILICCTYQGIVATSTHNIPVGEYKTELQDLGQHVEYPETPVKIIKITKTIAVKIPVPYPVKVVEKIPYPVHVSKPYPVPVTQIVHVPQPSVGHAGHGAHASYDAPVGHEGNGPPASYEAAVGDVGHGGYGSPASYNEPVGHGAHSAPVAEEHPSADNSYHGQPSDYKGGSFEAKSYDEAFNEYLKTYGGGNQPASNHYHR